MSRLSHRHNSVPLRSGNSGPLTPHEERDGNEQDRTGEAGDQDVQILHSHACNPRRDGKEDNDGKGVSGENHSDEGIADYLEVSISF